jgi:precorrin-2 dehydrogenase/sirohydrochlorin ferrochelatase
MKHSAGPPPNKNLTLFPIFVDLAERKCIVVGAGHVAQRKINGLLHHNAHVEVVSPRAVRDITQKARAGIVTWHKRPFLPEDLRGAFLVVAATRSSRINQAIFQACTAQGILCNCVDQPRHCHFFYPAVVHRGPLQIAISTSGRSPALAARLRRQLEQQFPPEWAAWVEHVGALRRSILAGTSPGAARRRRLQQVASFAAFRSFLREPSPHASADARKKRR